METHTVYAHKNYSCAPVTTRKWGRDKLMGSLGCLEGIKGFMYMYTVQYELIAPPSKHTTRLRISVHRNINCCTELQVTVSIQLVHYIFAFYSQLANLLD